MTTMPPRELVGYALYSWDATTDPTRMKDAYLGLAGLIISNGQATLDDTWVIVDMVAAWDSVTGERRTFGDYRAMADEILARIGGN